ncbi:MAG TPA: GNAT family N-acetyltransferase [Alphaproteobacteria bacterium]|nr:GNAT family N-acetyltransferase [Alphaproteobacteria bacterium]
MSALDNPVWSALTGPHAAFAIGRGLARHYPRAVVPFSAVAEASEAAYADLAADLPAGVEARLFRPAEEPLPAGWESVSARPIVQMVAEGRGGAGGDDAEIVLLHPADMLEMLDLVAATKPGPFEHRTIEMGRYVGIRRDGKLVAMAGERLRLPGHVEISAICTHPDARGQGLAARLTRHLMNAIVAEGSLPFLHVYADSPAMPLYERLGFRPRTTMWVLWRRPGAGGPMA